MKAKKISKYRLTHYYGISTSRLHRMKMGQPVTTTTLDRLCKVLNCEIKDIISYIPDEEQPEKA